MQASPSRNAPCPCGSGKKYKRCCGAGTRVKAAGPAASKREQVIHHYQQGNHAAASQLAEQALVITPDDVTLLELTAVIALQNGDPQRAIERFRRQLALQPGNALAHSNLCMALRMAGDNDAAFQHGQQATLLDPALADAWNNLGNLYESGNKLTQAAEHYARALALDDSDPRVHLNAGSVSLKLGKPEAAETHFRNALAIQPELPAAWNNLAAALLKQGRYEEADAAYRHALELQPGNPELLSNYAALLIQLDQDDRARELLAEAIQHHPDHVGTLVCLGNLAERAHDVDSMTRYHERVLALDPGNSTVLCNLGYRAFELGQQAEAVEWLLQAIENNPNSAKALAGLGKAMLREDNVVLAEDYIGRALALSPQDVHTHIARAQLHERQHHHEQAEAEWDRVIEQAPALGEGYTGKAMLLENLGRTDAARKVFESAETAGASDVGLYHAWSALEERQHRLEAARDLAARAQALDPAYPGLLILQAKLARRQQDYSGALTTLDQLDKASIENRQILSSYHFERGDILDRLGRYTEAFAAYEAANEAKNQYIGTSYDADKDQARFDKLKQFFTRDYLQAVSGTGSKSVNDGLQPIFIVGFPRSGTSLLEQILGSHPHIAAAGELTFINDLTEREAAALTGSKLPYPDLLTEHGTPPDAERLARMRDFYLEHMARSVETNEDTRWVTDKMPHNALHLGLIASLFPSAPVIHIVRHPLNACLSAYFANFRSGHRYTSSLVSTAQHYARVMDMLGHYQAIGIEVLEVRYEDLVTRQEQTLRKILAHIGAPWDNACMEHHKSARVVKTASYEQVTRKIYTSSLYRYRNYREAILPAVPVLANTMEHYGYTLD